MPNLIRSFIAVELEHNLQTGFAELITRLKNLNLDAKWVSPGNIHLTLKFLGNVNEDTIPEIKSCLDEIAKDICPFSFSIEKLGAFPDLNFPRILFIRFLDETQTASVLQKKIEREMCVYGFEKENRPFSPHLTLARIKSRKNCDKLKKFIAENPEIVIIDNSIADGITLFKSVLTSSGAVYTVLHKARFKT